jgi:nicotinamidase-related amidase
MSYAGPQPARRQTHHASMKKTALLLVDSQDSFKTGDRWSRRGNHAFEENVSRLLNLWREADLPRFFVLHIDADPGFRESDPEWRLMDFMKRRDDEPVVVKNTRNAFTSTDLQKRLEKLGVERLVITGIQMEQCCETTARVAADLGYEVEFVTDATQTFPIRNRATGEELSTAAITERTEYVLRDRFARIITAKDLAAEMKGALQSTT